jgi:hypothetical protein
MTKTWTVGLREFNSTQIDVETGNQPFKTMMAHKKVNSMHVAVGSHPTRPTLGMALYNQV